MSTDATVNIVRINRMARPRAIVTRRKYFSTLQSFSSKLSLHSTIPLHLTALMRTVWLLKISTASHSRSLAVLAGKYSKHLSKSSSEPSGHCGIPSHTVVIGIHNS